jgi:hypothetical protein
VISTLQLGQFGRTQRQAAPLPPDPNFASVVWLLHMDGTNGSTTFTDSSSLAHIVSAHGAAALSTARPKFGSAAGEFGGVNDYVDTSYSSDFQMGSGAFTLDAWFTPDNLTGSHCLIGCGNGTANTALEFFLVTTGNQLQFSVHVGSTQFDCFAGTLSIGTTYFARAVRSGNNIQCAINGVAGSSQSLGGGTVTLNNPTGGSISSGRVQTLYPFDGMIDDVRVTKGVARTITELPTAAFPNF